MDMTAHEFAARLQAKLEVTAEHWRTLTDDPHAIATGVMVTLTEVADCIRHALVESKPPYKKRTNRRKKK
jgi:hypothetical protein